MLTSEQPRKQSPSSSSSPTPPPPPPVLAFDFSVSLLKWKWNATERQRVGVRKCQKMQQDVVHEYARGWLEIKDESGTFFLSFFFIIKMYSLALWQIYTLGEKIEHRCQKCECQESSISVSRIKIFQFSSCFCWIILSRSLCLLLHNITLQCFVVIICLPWTMLQDVQIHVTVAKRGLVLLFLRSGPCNEKGNANADIFLFVCLFSNVFRV